MSAVEAREYGIVDTIVGANEVSLAADRAEAAVQDAAPRTERKNGQPH